MGLAWSRWVAPRRAGTGEDSVPSRRGKPRRSLAARCLAAAGAAGLLLAQFLGGLPAAAQTSALPGTIALPGSAFPLVLDVDLTPNPVCSGAVRGRVQVYDPAAAKAGATVEWRIRTGEKRLAGGHLTMAANVGTAEFSIPFDRVPAAETALQIDARIAVSSDGQAPGRYGKVWRDTIRRGCDPVRVASVGDSVVWGRVWITTRSSLI